MYIYVLTKTQIKKELEVKENALPSNIALPPRKSIKILNYRVLFFANLNLTRQQQSLNANSLTHQV